MDVSEFTVTFRRDPIFGFWSWAANAGETKLRGPLMGSCVSKEGAERDALRRLRLHCDRYELSGDELAERAAG